ENCRDKRQVKAATNVSVNPLQFGRDLVFLIGSSERHRTAAFVGSSQLIGSRAERGRCRGKGEQEGRPLAATRIMEVRAPSPGQISCRNYCSTAPWASSLTAWRRSNCGRFCENAERGTTISQPASIAFIFKSPCRCDRKPIMLVCFFSFDLSL